MNKKIIIFSIFAALLPFIIFHYFDVLTYMHSTWDDFTLRFILSGEDKMGGPFIFTGSDFMIHHFEIIINHLYRFNKNFYWFDLIISLPIFVFGYLITKKAIKLEQFKNKFSLICFFYIFLYYIYISCNLHYSLSAIVAGFIGFDFIRGIDQPDNQVKYQWNYLSLFLMGITIVIGFCTRYEFFILGFAMATYLEIISFKFKIKKIFNIRIVIFIPCLIFLMLHFKNAIWYNLSSDVNQKRLGSMSLNELSRFDSQKFWLESPLIKDEKIKSNYQLISKYIYFLDDQQLDKHFLDKILNETKKFPEKTIDRLKNIFHYRLSMTHKSIIIFIFLLSLFYFEKKQILYFNLKYIFSYFSFILFIEFMLKTMIERHILGFNLGFISFLYFLPKNSSPKSDWKKSYLIPGALIFVILYQSNKFYRLQSIKITDQQSKMPFLKNEIYLTDQNFPYHVMIKPFNLFNQNGPLPVPINWSFFHGNIYQFLISWGLDKELKSNLINGKIKLIMDKEKIDLIKQYLLIEYNNLKIIDHSQKNFPIYQFQN